MKYYHVLALLVIFYLAYLGGFARADEWHISTVERIVIALDDHVDDVVDTYKDILDSVIPVDDMSLYVKKDEVGIRWEF
jgi:hypothetical protein